MDSARITFSDEAGALRLADIPSLDWWKSKQHAHKYAVSDFPTFDEAWLLWLVFQSEPPRALEAVSHYAEDVRQGRYTDRVEPEQSAQAIYLALAQATASDRRAFLDEVQAFFDVIARRVLAGDAIATTPLFANEPRFQKYIAALVDDRRLYREDLQRSQTWRVSIPPRSVKLLALDKPASTQFKLWARRLDDCALLLVRQPDGTLVLSADPSSKLKVDWAAPLLSKLDEHPWYAGERHNGTLIASSREGTRLSFEDVRRALGGRLPTSRALLAVPVLVTVFAVTLAVFRPHAAAEKGAPSGAKGDPIPRAEVLNLLQRPGGPQTFEHYALIAGVCSYTGERALTAPCNDARALRKVLIERFGYAPQNVLLFVDDDAAERDGIPDAPSLKLAVERFRERFPKADADSSFLFYYSGHGGYEKGARKDFGVLQPAGYFENVDAPMMSRGWDMEELMSDLRKGVPSKHVMVVLDACYSGWAVGAKGDAELSPELRTLWAERAEVVLTAGTKGQRAWEDDPEAPKWDRHSAFTAFLLQGLEQGDVNSDRVITDEELAAYLKKNVPLAVKSEKHADQTPQFFRFDEALPKSGQFLFVRPP
jgi:hypothetical protein